MGGIYGFLTRIELCLPSLPHVVLGNATPVASCMEMCGKGSVTATHLRAAAGRRQRPAAAATCCLPSSWLH